MATKQMQNQDELQEALKAFGANAVEAKNLIPTRHEWTDSDKYKPLIVKFIGKKVVEKGKNGKQFELCLFELPNGNLISTSLGVNTAAMESVEHGDVLMITYHGKTKLASGNTMNDFDIRLVGKTEF